MSETTNEDLKAMLVESISANKSMHEANALRMAADARANGEQIAAMKADLSTKVQAVTNGLSNLEQRFSVVEGKANIAESTARQAMVSHHSLEEASQQQWRSVMDALDAQNLASEKVEREKRETKEAESIAAKRLNERRDYRVKMATVVFPIVGILITAAAAIGGSYIANERSHEETISKFSDTNAKIDRLTTTVAAATTEFPPAAASAPPAKK